MAKVDLNSISKVDDKAALVAVPGWAVTSLVEELRVARECVRFLRNHFHKNERSPCFCYDCDARAQLLKEYDDAIADRKKK